MAGFGLRFESDFFDPVARRFEPDIPTQEPKGFPVASVPGRADPGAFQTGRAAISVQEPAVPDLRPDQ